MPRAGAFVYGPLDWKTGEAPGVDAVVAATAKAYSSSMMLEVIMNTLSVIAAGRPRGEEASARTPTADISVHRITRRGFVAGSVALAACSIGRRELAFAAPAQQP